ncbi:MAG: hypothetical protein CBE50_002940 [Flammeovirgaceae bacterium TMED290]|nr:MAG: hypothetical protein CBE50_002940 [Flammeovirgaceae bacterium TMED290]|tara:strand:+ start:3421 stop:3651 length:231 start_codon:yes stop_codon:yes gene_type:complete
MRVVKSFFIDDINVNIFEYNLKYIIKFESNDMEQTYKVDMTEVVDINDLILKIDNKYINNIKQNFELMKNQLIKLY